MKETTQGFRDGYFFLSNFYVHPVTIHYQGHDFTLATGEHVFQGMKIAACSLPLEERLQKMAELAADPDPAKAKQWGRSLPIDIAKWDTMAKKSMKRSLELKFKDEELRSKLVATKDLQLVEYNDWSDTLWGKDKTTRKGRNLLGELLMELRAFLASPWNELK